MNTSRLTISEATSLMWEELKYRHELFWKSLNLWGFSAVSVSIFPWINPEIIQKLGKFVLIFPITAALIALFAAWHIGSENARIAVVSERYRELLRNYKPRNFQGKDSKVFFLYKLPIGKVVPGVFLCIAIPISFINGFFLLSQIQSHYFLRYH